VLTFVFFLSRHNPYRIGDHIQASNADEARAMKAAADRSGCVLMEAFHSRYHPLAQRMKAIIDSGELGALQDIRVHFGFPWVPSDNIRLNFELGGGALMDTGCYTINLLRYLGGGKQAEEPEVTAVRMSETRANVDGITEAELRFPSGARGHIICAIKGWMLPRIHLRVEGSLGTMKVLNPIAPQVVYHRLAVDTVTTKRVERLKGESSYYLQLDAFCRAVQDDEYFPTHSGDAILNMAVIDRIYEAAGLPRRGQARETVASTVMEAAE